MMLIQLFTWALILYCVMSMLLGFRILDPGNRLVYNVAVFLGRIVEPVLNPVRSILPQFGALDLSLWSCFWHYNISSCRPCIIFF